MITVKVGFEKAGAMPRQEAIRQAHLIYDKSRVLECLISERALLKSKRLTSDEAEKADWTDKPDPKNLPFPPHPKTILQLWLVSN